MRLQVQPAARTVGIDNANMLAKRTGLSTNTTYDIWEGVVKRIDLETLAILCDALKCSVQRILVKRWDTDYRLIPNHPARVKQAQAKERKLIRL